MQVRFMQRRDIILIISDRLQDVEHNVKQSMVGRITLIKSRFTILFSFRLIHVYNTHPIRSSRKEKYRQHKNLILRMLLVGRSKSQALQADTTMSFCDVSSVYRTFCNDPMGRERVTRSNQPLVQLDPSSYRL